MHWSARYIGKPYVDGEYDCADLCVEVARDVFDHTIQLPQHAAGLRGQSKQIRTRTPAVATPTNTPVEGDAVLMLARGLLSHIGVYAVINNTPHCLHAMKSAGQVVLHRIVDLPRHGLAVEGYYRWQ